MPARGLGERFPQEKLVDLMDATKPNSPKVTRTLRWNVRPGELEFTLAGSLNSVVAEIDGSAEEGWMRLATQSFRGCAALIQDAKDPSSISQDQWLARCSFESFRDEVLADESSSESARMIARMIELATYLGGARKIRKDLGVEVDDRQARQQRVCPAV